MKRAARSRAVALPLPVAPPAAAWMAAAALGALVLSLAR